MKKCKECCNPNYRWVVVREVNKFNWELAGLTFLISFAGMTSGGLFLLMLAVPSVGVAAISVINHVFGALVLISVVIAVLVGWLLPEVDYKEDTVERRFAYGWED